MYVIYHHEPKAVTVINPILQMHKLRHKEAWPSDRNGQNQILNLGLCIPGSTLPTPVRYFASRKLWENRLRFLMAGEETIQTPGANLKGLPGARGGII